MFSSRWLVVFICICSLPVMAIDGSKRISYQELLNRMTEAKEELTLSNYTVFYNPETDRRFMDDREEYVNQLDTL